MITVDLEQEMATDHGEIWIGEAEEGIPTIITMQTADDNQLCITYTDSSNERINLYMPVERFRKLLSETE